MKYDKQMDKECVRLCDAINKIPGLKTCWSCCGHGKEKFQVWFEVESVKNLPILLYFLDPQNSMLNYWWQCEVVAHFGMGRATFQIIADGVGKEVYGDADEIADQLENFFSCAFKRNFCPVCQWYGHKEEHKEHKEHKKHKEKELPKPSC